MASRRRKLSDDPAHQSPISHAAMAAPDSPARPPELISSPASSTVMTKRVTRSMGLPCGVDTPSEVPATPTRTKARRARKSPYFTPSPSPSPSKKRAAAIVPADLSPYILAQQLRPAVPLHPIERQPHHYGLLQEVCAPDPWRLIIAVCLLNQTSGRAVRPVFWQLLETYPTPKALAEADEMELTAILYPIGLYRIRAKRLIAFSKLYVEQPPADDIVHVNKNDKYYKPTPISHYPGVGTYALDSYQIFIAGGGASIVEPRSQEPSAPWRSVLPGDKELRKYLIWRHAIDGNHWTPEQGLVGPLPPDVTASHYARPLPSSDITT